MGEDTMSKYKVKSEKESDTTILIKVVCAIANELAIQNELLKAQNETLKSIEGSLNNG